MKLSPNEGVGNAGCRSHPQPRMQSKKAYELVTTGPPAYPAFPHAMVLTAYFALFPVIGLPCHRRLTNVTCPRPVGPTRLRKTWRRRRGVRTTRLHRPQQRLSSARSRSLTGWTPPCDPIARFDAAASTASRPASVTIASAPQWDETARLLWW